MWNTPYQATRGSDVSVDSLHDCRVVGNVWGRLLGMTSRLASPCRRRFAQHDPTLSLEQGCISQPVLVVESNLSTLASLERDKN